MEKEKNDGDVLVASAYNKNLYLSKLEGMFPENATKEDSLLFINSYVERWVRESVLLHAAESHVPKELDIDELVRSYRSSLIKHNYEKMIVESLMDTLVTEQELNEYYEKNSDQFQLQSPVLRCYFIKIDKNHSELEALKQWWPGNNEDNFKKIVEFCNKNANNYLLKKETWYKSEDIINQIPKRFLNTALLNSNTVVNATDENFHYFLKVFEIINAKSDAPLSFVSDQLTKVILHKRKIQLLEQKKEEMYESALHKNNIKIFNQ